MNLLLLATLVQFSLVACRPDGAPTAACVTMTPQHGGTIQDNAKSPYTITAGSSTAKSGSTVTITVSATDSTNTNLHYRGILLEARTGQSTAPAGRWTPVTGHKTLDCPTGQALTHNSRNDKALPVQFPWSPPAVATNTTYAIYVTVVEVKRTYWIKLKSGDIMISPGPLVAPTAGPNSGGNTTSAAPSVHWQEQLFLLTLLACMLVGRW